MKKIKRKARTVIKYDQGEKYTFRNGVAIVPGVFYKGKPMKMSLNENELKVF